MPLLAALLAAAGALAVYVLYRCLLPKPIPGIPYNPEAASSILGDLPSLMRGAGDTMPDWLLKQSARHPNSPLVQLFLEPFGGRPFVLLTDFREAQDVMLRRGKEWDRSGWSIDLLGKVLPLHHVNLKMGHEWKAHRRLLQDLMTPTFLNAVAAPHLYDGFVNIVELWGARARAAGGRPFAAEADIHHATLDAVLDFTFGKSYPHRAIPPQTHHLRSASPLNTNFNVASCADEPVEITYVPIHESIGFMQHWSETFKRAIESPFPGTYLLINNLKPSEFRFRRRLRAFLAEQIDTAVERLESKQDGEKAAHGDEVDATRVGSAMDMMVYREKRLAEKEGREPVFKSQTMEQETLGFIIAGHDTSSTTLLWGLKLLADHPEIQAKLRAALLTTHVAAAAEKRLPSVQEITSGSPAPYLDAVIEEILRCGTTVPMLERSCDKDDAVVLGSVLPKGTTLIMLATGPSFKAPAHRIDEALRSEPSRKAAADKGKPGAGGASRLEWDAEGMNEFRPERWLVRRTASADATVTADDGTHSTSGWEFDASAGPSMPFGMGTRGCFGRRLGYLEQRISLTLLIWSFELLACPPELSGYEAVEGLTHRPRHCYVRLRPTGLAVC